MLDLGLWSVAKFNIGTAPNSDVRVDNSYDKPIEPPILEFVDPGRRTSPWGRNEVGAL